MPAGTPVLAAFGKSPDVCTDAVLGEEVEEAEPLLAELIDVTTEPVALEPVVELVDDPDGAAGSDGGLPVGDTFPNEGGVVEDLSSLAAPTDPEPDALAPTGTEVG